MQRKHIYDLNSVFLYVYSIKTFIHEVSNVKYDVEMYHHGLNAYLTQKYNILSNSQLTTCTYRTLYNYLR